VRPSHSIERAQAVARAPQTNHYTYEKRSLMAELDEKDRVIKSTEKLYKVMLIGGLPFPRLVKVQGRELTAQELEKQTERENAFRQRVTRMDLQRKAKRKEGVVTRELVDRLDFKVTKRDVVDGRKTLVLTFAGRPGGSEETIEDKVFKRVFGTVWVDEDEAEIVKFDAAVRGPIPLGWFGAIGSLNKFQATMERMRMPDGVLGESQEHIPARRAKAAQHHALQNDGRIEPVCSRIERVGVHAWACAAGQTEA
jgi:hypothetical protein